MPCRCWRAVVGVFGRRGKLSTGFGVGTIFLITPKPIERFVPFSTVRENSFGVLLFLLRELRRLIFLAVDVALGVVVIGHGNTSATAEFGPSQRAHFEVSH